MAKILIAEDERDIRDLVAFTLRFAGHEVSAAANGEEAVELATRVNPDLILMDVRMPRMTGYEACKVMKANPDLKDIPVVFLTARSEEYSEVAAFDVGADDYITKPIKPRALMSRISALFRRDSKKSSPASLITIGDLTIDRVSYTIKIVLSEFAP